MSDGTGWPRAMPAIVSPFSADEELDLSAHAHNVGLMDERGCRGVLVAGSTGLGPYLEPGERRTLIEVTRQAAPDMTVICAVHAESLRMAHHAVAECGEADAALVITPTSIARGRTKSIERFFTSVADAAPLPILLYTHPRLTGWELPIESIRSLSRHPNIVGMKDSGGNADRLAGLQDEIQTGFIVYTGASSALAASAKRGAWGAITASANYALHDVSLAGRGDQDAQQRLDALTAIVEAHGIPGTFHAASSVGLVCDHMRRPLEPIDMEAADAIAEALAVAGLGSRQ